MLVLDQVVDQLLRRVALGCCWVRHAGHVRN